MPPRAASRLTLLCLAALACGCAQKWVTLRAVPKNPLGDELQLTSWSGPQPSERTMQLLRVYNLTDDLQGDVRPLLEKVQRITEREPSADKVYALAELAYLAAVKTKDEAVALDLYSSCVLHAYAYLFDDRLAATRNCYDPHFRGACELYNTAMEAALRITCKHGELVPGRSRTIHTAGGDWDIRCELRGGNWKPRDFGRFAFVSDYEMKGLKNHYLTHGLGVPLIAVRPADAEQSPAARYYPPNLSFPVTAFLRPASGWNAGGRKQGLLELYDPLTLRDTQVGNLCVPLESDLTTPLAYYLSQVPMESWANMGLFHPDELLANGNQTAIKGLYMVQPYEPGKIPVVFVHGLWSSPMTWMEMFNDLRSSPDISRHYQFWFYFYPTGQPFWISAAALRRELADVRQVVDPEHREPALDQTVLVGHSMGGLVARLQTIESGFQFWTLASRVPPGEVKADAEVRRRLEDTFFFHPSPSVRRVVMIATPNHGSTFSNETTQYLLDKMIRLPTTLLDLQQQVFRTNPDMLFSGSLLTIKTSIDSLAPGCAVFPVLQSSRRPPWVKYHTIFGEIPSSSWLHALAKHGDGVVDVESARLEGADSELVVPCAHMTVHAHPLAVMEVRRILHEHLAELRGQPVIGRAGTAQR